MILNLINKCGLTPKRASAKEYHSSCPHCGGKDRFIIWHLEKKYWCRQCGKRGDEIQFCRDFLGMSYLEACQLIRVRPQILREGEQPKYQSYKAPLIATLPSSEWQEKGLNFNNWCQKQLLESAKIANLLMMRGFTSESLEKFRIGFNPKNFQRKLEEWGLPKGKNKLWLPSGITIPTFQEGKLIKLKIRRTDWKQADPLPKYVEVIGSMNAPSFYGEDYNKPIFIMESELDAMLTQEAAGDLCGCLAVGGVGRKPDLNTHYKLCNSPLLLFCMDYDEAGKKAYAFWRNTYSNLRAWPAPEGKSPGDALACFKINLRHWVEEGIKLYLKGTFPNDFDKKEA
ncbi:CHC2 zinc finger domain-containing protein [Candidatus Protochlamydia phocaeensis]|uniref:CHC2 zinc finger domain-containing protein n=1 Tax=Candidatus Protochlamydia phocaeensis TaxID=1414722 RepID=UPI0008380091|nr:CHC2 zinc finger domain-containing protein [Candidatus Protochlamydia phocaeensis]